MKAIQSTGYSILFQEDAYLYLNNHLRDNKYSNIFILVDENTREYCLPKFIKKISSDFKCQVISIKAGEQNKNIATCLEVWTALTNLQADRKSLLINLGGGMITDLGGFVASTFKRGINFINIPTTLLSIVDASVGSKTGVDLGNLKNLIGCFSDPEMVAIDTSFLKTMTDRDLKSGMAEIIKYGLSYDHLLWEKLKPMKNPFNENLNEFLHRSIEIKNEIVLQDPKEKSLRKVLNFGHTIGHAIESYFLGSDTKKALTHGEAIGIGMIIEAYASNKLLGFPKEEVTTLKNIIETLYGKVHIPQNDYHELLDLMKFDKKNVGSTVNFVLLEAVGAFKIDCEVPLDVLIEGLNYYNN
ncbi:MAG: 3-dehydroquinate synthase [Flavobacteriaceae bacterium]|nr:3-dehydroquinate synthase [Flavobacteriaceae bacterium]